MNLEFVEQIVRLIGDYPVSEISVEQDGRRVCVRRPLTETLSTLSLDAVVMSAETNSQVADAPTEAVSLAEAIAEEARTLTATMVGIFHHAEPPLPYAAVVAPGQVVGSIESMKLMNDVLAETGGRVIDVLVEDGAPVEYGQALFRLIA